METMPTAAELIEAAAETLRNEVLPALQGRAAFQARVVAGVLDIAQRELRDGPAADAAEHARLRALLGADGEPAALRTALCDAIRTGRLDPDDSRLTAHLWADVLARVAIEQPAYPSYLHETGGAHARAADPASRPDRA